MEDYIPRRNGILSVSLVTHGAMITTPTAAATAMTTKLMMFFIMEVWRFGQERGAPGDERYVGCVVASSGRPARTIGPNLRS